MRKKTKPKIYEREIKAVVFQPTAANAVILQELKHQRGEVSRIINVALGTFFKSHEIKNQN